MSEHTQGVIYLLNRMMEALGMVGLSFSLFITAAAMAWFTRSPWMVGAAIGLAVVMAWVSIHALWDWRRKKIFLNKIACVEEISRHSAIATVRVPEFPNLKWPVCCHETDQNSIRDLPLNEFMSVFTRGGPVCAKCEYLVNGFEQGLHAVFRCPECGVETKIKRFRRMHQLADEAMNYRLEKMWRERHPGEKPFPE